jgi:hypothetical protein
LKLNDRHILVVSVTQKNPVAVVCASLPDFHGSELSLEEAEQCYFTDRTGQLFAESPSFSGTAHKRYYAPDIREASTTGIILGTSVLEPEKFEELQTFYDSVRAAGIRAEAVLIKPEGEYELYVRNPGESAGEEGSLAGTVVIYFNTAGDFSLELANLISFWASMKEERFDSIDVRYGSNVFYRLNH